MGKAEQIVLWLDVLLVWVLEDNPSKHLSRLQCIQSSTTSDSPTLSPNTDPHSERCRSVLSAWLKCTAAHPCRRRTSTTRMTKRSQRPSRRHSRRLSRAPPRTSRNSFRFLARDRSTPQRSDDWAANWPSLTRFPSISHQVISGLTTLCTYSTLNSIRVSRCRRDTPLKLLGDSESTVVIDCLELSVNSGTNRVTKWKTSQTNCPKTKINNQIKSVSSAWIVLHCYIWLYARYIVSIYPIYLKNI